MSEMFQQLDSFAENFVTFMALLFTLVVAIGIAALIWIYISDISQTRQTIRRNYPIIGRFRYFFEHLGEFFRQYFFALDREELPFNRAQRTWVYRAAKNIDATVAFGSTNPLNVPGDFLFLNSLFPPLPEEIIENYPVTFGETFSLQPYSTDSFFNISGMSYGALSGPAIQALSLGAANSGIWLNTGEGGSSPYHEKGACDLVFQMGTAKYGLRNKDGELCEEKLLGLRNKSSIKMIEIKISQGAKPGKGGILPGIKVDEIIASSRGITIGEDSISPGRHPEIENVEGLLNFINYVRDISGKPTGIKCVIGQSEWLDDMCHQILRKGLKYAPDFMTVDSGDGGSGAAPMSLIDHMGLPIKRSLPLVVDKLTEFNLRSRIKVIASGKLINPADVAAALCLGADSVNSARGFMFALGCIQALQCNKNTCPTGITTQDPNLQDGLDPFDKGARVGNYAQNLTKAVKMIAHACGVKHPRLLRRTHAQMITEKGIPETLSKIYPDKSPLQSIQMAGT